MNRRLAAALALGLLGATAATASAAGAATAAADKPSRANIRVTPVPSGTTFELNGVSFPDTVHGHAVGVDGTMLVTADGGATWAPQSVTVKTTPYIEDLSGVSFPDALHGYAVGSEGTVLTTTDGGSTWTQRELPVGGAAETQTFKGVSFTDPLAGYAVGGHLIFTTVDGGVTWSTFHEARFGGLLGVTAVDRLTGFVVGASGHATQGASMVTASTVDGGRTWKPLAADLPAEVANVNFNAAFFTDSLNGHVVGDSGRILATTDGGQTWTVQRSGRVEELNGVSFFDTRRGVAVGTVTFPDQSQRALVFATDDGGQTWVSRIVPDTVRLQSGVDFLDRDTAYAVGCRRDKPGTALGESACAEGAVVKISFLAPQPASPGGSSSSLPILVGGVALAAIAAGGIVVGRRHRSRR